MNEKEEIKEISITKISAYCPKCSNLNYYEIKGLFTSKEKKQKVNPVLTCSHCNSQFWITVTNKKEDPKIFFNL